MASRPWRRGPDPVGASASPEGDRAAFLERVGRAVGGIDAPGSADAVREVATHLDDQVADLLAAGVEREDAERQAVRGMGDPERLGRDLARARRTPRRALALAGYGALTYGVFGVAWLFVAWAAFALLAGFAVTVGGLVFSTGWPTAPRGYAGIAVGMVAGPWATRGTVSLLTTLAPWPARTVRVASGVVVLVGGLAIALLLPGQELDDASAWLLLAVPCVAASAALAAPGRSVVGPGRAQLVLVLAVIVLPTFVWPRQVDPLSVASGVETSGIARSREATIAAGVPLPDIDTFGVGEEDGREVFEIGYRDLAGWRGLEHQVWVVTSSWGHELGLADAPIVVAPFTTTAHRATATFAMPRFRQSTMIVGVDVGIAPDGVRSLLGMPNPDRTPPWRGSVLDWLSGR